MNTVNYRKNNLPMESIHVDDIGMNKEACRYFISYVIHDFWYALLLCYYCGVFGKELVWAVSGIIHNPLLLSIGPCMAI